MRLALAASIASLVVGEDLRYQTNALAYMPRPGLNAIEAALGPTFQRSSSSLSATRPRRFAFFAGSTPRAIKETWGQRCTKLLFMSNVEDDEIPTVRVVAPATHDHLWQKHRFVVRLLAREYDASEYDWIFKCDDDTYVIMDNLLSYLHSVATSMASPDEPTLLGHRMTLQWFEMQKPFHDLSYMQRDRRRALETVLRETRNQGGLYYTPGGAGYAFNSAYLTQLVAALDEPSCLPDEVVPDDWAISFCMYHRGVVPTDTRDSLHRERFHQYSPEQVYYWPDDVNDFDHWNYASIYDAQNWFSDHIGIGWRNGSDCCAPDSVSFHYVHDMHLVDAYFELRKNAPK
ncbi:hypothetical protein SPRG_14361 [Saprolegnia parasitica CBS 223.65]|uniref:N-acetylgalactosaminide beta-1,3-galactosyltransferase n=1 Tax=Saprolegnia parasitica (strain CBS 223.65) TaxID=695850 RepID=A0A067BQ84_SAPPC|nr:hypothetical protein SPRG_14361 [Saprolegnia parasitica CBS 223.65]KDO20423.1 hypothetical protein SPRG_14361 [Saprolegnia parasitica CBS 223.65]|eukprot:XP_012208879.1 hypothetical protein SPRG_14361 [Saprolegnia parasitica CBS 223.65]